ncbi:MAG TPA: ribonuclease Y [bacterium]|nr:ribonuclease Y [bacterium]HOL47620.1 ribonuclease Y [bacterium]HPQ19610.1 ribonuclease Y [bacterium]
MSEIELVSIIIGLIVGLIIGIVLKFIIDNKRIKGEQITFEQKRAQLEEELSKRKKQLELEYKEKQLTIRSKVEEEFKNIREELKNLENRLTKKEDFLETKEKKVEEKQQELLKKEQQLNELQKEVSELKEKEIKELEKICGLTSEEARQLLIDNMVNEAKYEATKLIKKIEEEAKKDSERRAKRIIALSTQRIAADYVPEITISTVALPSDEMKGRIIGREGRNIKEFEKCAKVDLIIDDTPEVVTIASFDPLRREIARIALEKLILDGRIHPARIEEIVSKTEKEVEKIMLETAEQAILDLGIPNVKEEIARLLGKLKYRTSYGQNVLQHSIEVAKIAGLMAAELGANVLIVKRMGLLHDIGKAVDSSVEGTHTSIGAELAKKAGENEYVVNAILAHHGDVEFKTVESVLVATADAISASRPGARKESVEAYLKRIEQIEQISNAYEGVEKSYAIQAGREVRVIVKSEKVSDEKLEILARDIAKEIEQKVEYPGIIKVTAIRETRIVEYAK